MLSADNALFVTNPTNIRYLTGFTGATPSEREAFVLMTRNKLFLFTNALYLESVKNTTLAVVEISRENPISTELKRIIDKLGVNQLEFEEANLTVAELRKLKQKLDGVTLIPTQDRIEKLRMIKKPDEIENMTLAARLTDQCFTFITHRIRPGVMESRLAMEIEGFFKFHGAENAFDPIVAFNSHSSQPHYHAQGNDPLRRGSLVLLDFGARVNGYCADMTRVVFLGKPNDEWKRAYTAVQDANSRALELLAKGERSGKILDEGAQKIISHAGFPPYPHSLGHAVGLDIHEAPRLSVKKDETLEPDMVVTVEPGVYIEGTYGIRIEDLVLLKSNGIKILSKSPKNIICL